MLVALFVSVAAFAGTVSVSPGVNTIKTALSSAQDGDTLLLANGDYTMSSNVDLSISVVIMASDSAVIAISGGASVRLRANNISVVLKNLVFDGGDKSGSERAVRIYSGVNNTTLRIEGCCFRDMERAITVYEDSKSSELYADDCLFYRVKRAFHVASAFTSIDKSIISNSTFVDCGDSSNRTVYFAQVDGDEQMHDANNLLDHCTFYNCKNTRVAYYPNLNGSVITNCIAMIDAEDTDCKSFAIYGVNSALRNSLSFNLESYVRSSAQSENNSAFSPLFVDAPNGNFMLYANSPCVGTATDGSNMGDPRWGVSTEEAPQWLMPYSLYKKPYSMSPTVNSIRILWQTADNYSAGVVRYGTDADNLNLTASSDQGWFIPGEGFVHIVELTGLQPFTRYYYQVGDGTRTFPDIHSTKTAPQRGQAFRIFTMSDIHVNSCSNWQNMQTFICSLEPDIAIFNGDFVNEGNMRAWNSAFFTPGEPFLSRVPIMSSPGNHETGDPAFYRYSTFYDYFSQFNHGYSEDTIKDPRGEAYFTFPYGNAQIVVVDINGFPSDPDFMPGSLQYHWLDSVLNASTTPWIFMFGHVGIYTSGYHGQWSEEAKTLAPLLESYAAKGKHIIYFCGDDHSFEHLYKDGVHYVRPGCGRNSNYAQVTTIVDAQYSMFYKQISCYSTLDMSADASEVLLTARDSASNVFYNYTFHLTGDEINPSVKFTYPMSNVSAIDSVLLQWSSFDPQKDAVLSFYYTSSADSFDGKLIAGGIPANPTATKRLWWKVKDIYPKQDYYVYSVITSGNFSDTVRLEYPVYVAPDTIAPAPPTEMKGDLRDGRYVMTWLNPTHEVAIDNTLQDFSSDYNGVVADGENGSAVLSVTNGTLQIDYTVNLDWGEGSANFVFDQPVDMSSSPTLSFRLKGDGSTNDLRIIVKNMAYGVEDWWYTEKYNLSSTNWQDCTINMASLTALDWHSNSDTKNALQGVVAICFIIPSANPCAGTIYIDDVHVSGFIRPADDYAGTVIRRSTGSFPQDHTEGTQIYSGTDEYCDDADIDPEVVYYYAAFSFDDSGNYSAAATSAQWVSTDLDPTTSLSYAGQTPLNDNMVTDILGRQYDNKNLPANSIYILQGRKEMTVK